MKYATYILAIGLIACSWTDSVLGQNWIQTSAPTTNWMAVASSADGSNFVATINTSPSLYRSMDGGNAWTEFPLPFGASRAIASAANGSNLIAGAIYRVYTSTNAGASWASNSVAILGFTARLAVSGNGNRLAVGGGEVDPFGVLGSPIFTSDDGGTTWQSNTIPKLDWSFVTCSSDGTTLMAGASGKALFVSTNFGVSWSSNGNPVASWSAGACSVDGTRLIAGAANGLLCRSADTGATWVSSTLPFSNLFDLAASTDGSNLVAVTYPGSIYTSRDFGATWVSNNAPVKAWISVACSADGNVRVAAAALGGGLYTSRSFEDPSLTIAMSGTNLVLSWVIPSAEFALQMCTDLEVANWANVPALPVRDYATLRDVVVMPMPAESTFFRLAR